MEYVMQVDVTPSQKRGITQNDWLNSKHSFSFGSYYNLNRLNFGTLRVVNDDVIAPGKGFGTHSHDNMEIITIVLEGSLEHTDSVGNKGVISPGDVQRMSAGKGIKHSEYNASKDESVRLLQIWIYPEKRDLEPGYEQKHFPIESFENRLLPIVSPTLSDESVFIHQDATLYLGHFSPGQTITHNLRNKKHGDYIFIIEGQVALGDKILKAGDSAQITGADCIEIQTQESSKILLIEVGINTL